jgi:hypothetical protein
VFENLDKTVFVRIANVFNSLYIDIDDSITYKGGFNFKDVFTERENNAVVLLKTNSFKAFQKSNFFRRLLLDDIQRNGTYNASQREINGNSTVILFRDFQSFIFDDKPIDSIFEDFNEKSFAIGLDIFSLSILEDKQKYSAKVILESCGTHVIHKNNDAEYKRYFEDNFKSNRFVDNCFQYVSVYKKFSQELDATDKSFHNETYKTSIENQLPLLKRGEVFFKTNFYQ